jgi:hypothetical protein
MPDIEAYPGETNGWAALEAAHIDALRARGELPPTPEEIILAAAAAAEPETLAAKPKARKRGLDDAARKRLGHKP